MVPAQYYSYSDFSIFKKYNAEYDRSLYISQHKLCLNDSYFLSCFLFLQIKYSLRKKFLSYLQLNYVIIPHLSFPPLLAFQIHTPTPLNPHKADTAFLAHFALHTLLPAFNLCGAFLSPQLNFKPLGLIINIPSHYPFQNYKSAILFFPSTVLVNPYLYICQFFHANAFTGLFS